MTDDEFDLYSDSDLRRILPELIEENKRLRGLLREAREYIVIENDGGHCGDRDCGECNMTALAIRIDAALAGTANQQFAEPSGEIRPDPGAVEAETSGAAICCVNWPRCECDVNERFNHSITDQPAVAPFEYEEVGFQYKFHHPTGDGFVWRLTPSPYNGQTNPIEHRVLYVRRLADPTDAVHPDHCLCDAHPASEMDARIAASQKRAPAPTKLD